jgi:hypothetical protein
MEFEKDGLAVVQNSLSETYPRLAELDLDKLNDVYMLMWATSMMARNTPAVTARIFSYSTQREDGVTEKMSLEWIERDGSEAPSWYVSVSSDDGTLSPKWAEFTADMLNDSHQDEISKLISE